MPTVLIADDEPAILGLVESVLAEHGLNVLRALDGEEALRLATSLTVDLVVSDVVMPKMDGEALACRLGQLKPDLPVILMSGYCSAKPGRLESMFLEKPFTPAVLLEKVTALLGRREPMRKTMRRAEGVPGRGANAHGQT